MKHKHRKAVSHLMQHSNFQRKDSHYSMFLFPKIDEIRLFGKNNPLDVLAFSETWLSEYVSNSEISIQGYLDPIRRDRQFEGHGGGSVAVYFKSSVLHKEICSISCPELESSAIKFAPRIFHHLFWW